MLAVDVSSPGWKNPPSFAREGGALAEKTLGMVDIAL